MANDQENGMTNDQGIDMDATREAIRAKGMTLPGYARSHNLDPAKFPTRFYNNVRFTDDELQALRADGLLVEMQDAA